MMNNLVICENVLDPKSWVKHPFAGDVREVLTSHFVKWPDNARLYYKNVSKATDITPFDEKSVEILGELEGDFYVVVYPGHFALILLIIQLVITAVSLTLSFLLRPSSNLQNQHSPSPNNEIGNKQNKERPNERIPDIYGEVWSIPDLIQVTYNIFVGNREVQYAFMCIGRGEYDIEEVRDGTTPLDEIAGSGAEVYAPFTSPNSGDIPQLRVGAPIGKPVVSVTRSNAVDGQVLIAPNAVVFVGNKNVIFLAPDTIELSGTGDFTSQFAINDKLQVANAIAKDPLGVHASLDMSGIYYILAVSPTSIQLWTPVDVNANWTALAAFDSGAGDSSVTSATLLSNNTGWVGPFIIADADTDEVWCNFVCVNGLYELDKNGNQTALTITVELEVIAVDESNVPVGIPTYFQASMTGSTTTKDYIGVTLKAVLPQAGAVQIRMRRISNTDLRAGYSVVDPVQWRDCYSVSNVPQSNFGNVTTIQTVTVATRDALTVKESKLNVKVTRRIPSLYGNCTATVPTKTGPVALTSYQADAIFLDHANQIMWSYQNTYVAKIDAVTGAILHDGTIDHGIFGNAFAADANYFYVGYGTLPGSIAVYDATTFAKIQDTTFIGDWVATVLRIMSTPAKSILVSVPNVAVFYILDRNGLTVLASGSLPAGGKGVILDKNNHLWILSIELFSNNTHLSKVVLNDNGTIASQTDYDIHASITGGSYLAYDEFDNSIIVSGTGIGPHKAVKFDIATGVVIETYDGRTAGTYCVPQTMSGGVDKDFSTIWVDTDILYRYSLTDFSIIESWNLNTIFGLTGIESWIYDETTNSVWVIIGAAGLYNIKLPIPNAPATILIRSTDMPWDFAGGINGAYDYGQHDGTTGPIVPVTPGQLVSIRKVSSTVTDQGGGAIIIPVVIRNGWVQAAQKGPYENTHQGTANPFIFNPEGTGPLADGTTLPFGEWHNGDAGNFTIDFAGAATNAIDGNPGSKTYAYSIHSHQYFGCIWGFTSPLGASNGLQLSVISAVTAPVQTLRSAGIWYSLDGGTTWANLYNVTTRLLQRDIINLPNGTDPAQVRVMAFVDAHDDMGMEVYDIQLNLTTTPVGSFYPSHYMPSSHLKPLEPCGAFIDAGGNVIKPLPIGNAVTAEVPIGATGLRFGINDNFFANNSGTCTLELSMVCLTTTYHPGVLLPSKNAADIIAAMALDKYIGNRVLSEVDILGIHQAMADAQDYFGTELCTEFSFTFDDYRVSFEESVADIAASVFCIAYRNGNVLSLSFEKLTANSKLLFNHRNKIPGSETRTITFGTTSEYDGIELNYTDPNAPNFPDQDTVVTLYFPTDKSAVNPKKIQTVGIRNNIQAQLLGWRLFQKLKYQNAAVQFDATQEAALSIVSDRILVADNTRPDTQDGEVIAQVGFHLTLSQNVVFVGGLTYTIFLQHYDETVEAIGITAGANPNEVILAGAPAIPLVLDDNGFAKTTYVIVSNAQAQATAFLLSEKSPKDGQQYQVKGINYDDRYYSHDQDFASGALVLNTNIPSGVVGYSSGTAQANVVTNTNVTDPAPTVYVIEVNGA